MIKKEIKEYIAFSLMMIGLLAASFGVGIIAAQLFLIATGMGRIW